MVLLISILSIIFFWLYHNFYEYFTFLCGMYVTVNIVEKACDLADAIADQGADTEEVFEECWEELYPTAPLAVPELFGKFCVTLCVSDCLCYCTAGYIFLSDFFFSCSWCKCTYTLVERAAFKVIRVY